MGCEQWVQVDGYGVRVSVAPDGAAWVVNSQNDIHHFVNGRFDRLPGTATDIGVGGDGTAWIIGTDSNVYRWTHDNWERMVADSGDVVVEPRAIQSSPRSRHASPVFTSDDPAQFHW